MGFIPSFAVGATPGCVPKMGPLLIEQLVSFMGPGRCQSTAHSQRVGAAFPSWGLEMCVLDSRKSRESDSRISDAETEDTRLALPASAKMGPKSMVWKLIKFPRRWPMTWMESLPSGFPQSPWILVAVTPLWTVSCLFSSRYNSCRQGRKQPPQNRSRWAFFSSPPIVALNRADSLGHSLLETLSAVGSSDSTIAWFPFYGRLLLSPLRSPFFLHCLLQLTDQNPNKCFKRRRGGIWPNQLPFVLKTLNKLRIEGNFPNPIKH